MRPDCWNCTIKHLGTAAAYQDELEYYPNFFMRMIGEMVHASMECARVHQPLASVIRDWRLVLESDPRADVPFEDLYAFIKICQSIDNARLDDPTSASTYPELPEEIKVVHNA